MNVKNLLKVTKEQGAIGVLAVWLAFTTWDLQNAKKDFIECLTEQIPNTAGQVSKASSSPMVAILPKEIEVTWD